jgi:hypothetical protein
LCEIDTGPLHFDSAIGKFLTFAFFAVFGTRDVGQDEVDIDFNVKVFNNGQSIHYEGLMKKFQSARSDHVWLTYTSYHSQLTTNNLQVKFKIKHPSLSVFFKSCGFHIVEQGYDDDESDRNPIEQR